LKIQRYTKQISPKTLAAPSSKDFLFILEFLYQQFDPQFKIGKPEDDVVFIFKTLKYVLSLAVHQRVLSALQVPNPNIKTKYSRKCRSTTHMASFFSRVELDGGVT
jgi:SMC interacting uncharacterized protein involved in chromosome segregation